MSSDKEVLETGPILRAEIDDNPEPDLFEPTPENYSEEVSEEPFEQLMGVLTSGGIPELELPEDEERDSPLAQTTPPEG